MKSSRYNAIVWRLLRHNISVGQLVGYALANLVGLVIVLTAVQFYRDVTSVDGGDDAFLSQDYIVVSKRVNGLGSLLGDEARFSDSEIADLEKQSWADDLGRFTASQYSVYASVEMAGRGMSTALFFESIPDRFFDVKPTGWAFDPSQDEIPIIISKDYLALYNFGFATSRGLPQISEEMVQMIPLRIAISGNGKQQYFSGRIVGFSSRLNTIAVPQSFMQWANSQFSTSNSPLSTSPSRVILKVVHPGNPEMTKYLESHGYEIAGDKLSNGKILSLLSLVTSIVIIVGIVISMLALFILFLSIHLLLQKNREKLHNLILLGYNTSNVAGYYYALVLVINVIVLLLALIIVAISRTGWIGILSAIGTPSAGMLSTALLALSITAIITVLNIATIHRNITRLTPSN